MVRLIRSFLEFRANPFKYHLLWWLILTLGLAGLFLLARLADPDSLLLYQQLVILYVIDSLLLLFTDRTLVKIGILILIFLTAMEMMVGIFYIISLASVIRL